jgi:D-3-phosphoglycerate dehydrogenase
MINQETISRMKKSAFIVNVSRGEVIDEEALAVALNEGRIAGAALDVYANEPLEDDSPLRGAPGVVLTPHLGASTLEAQELVATEISEAVRDALLEGDLSHALNAPGFGGVALLKFGPVFDLGRRLGLLACALARGGIKGIEVRYSGESEEVLSPLTAHVLMGLLKNIIGARSINLVSAGYLARQRGIDIALAHLSRRTDYSEFVEVIVKAEGEDLRLAGALLGDMHPRVVRIRDYHVDIVPDGTLIVLRNQDVPGVIGRVGTLLGAHSINIAEYHQARLTMGGDALAAIAVDGKVDSTVRDALMELQEVSAAVVIRLS